MLRPMTRHRPFRKPDGEGGYEQGYMDGETIYGGTSFDGEELVLVYPASQDIQASDVIESPGGEYYRVIQVQRATGASHVRATIEKVERPISG